MGGVFDEGGIVASHHETGLQAIGHLLDVATERSGDLGIGGFGDGDVAFLGEGDGAADDGVVFEELMDVVAGLWRHALGEGVGRDEGSGGEGDAEEEGAEGRALGKECFHAHTIECAYDKIKELLGGGRWAGRQASMQARFREAWVLSPRWGWESTTHVPHSWRRGLLSVGPPGLKQPGPRCGAPADDSPRRQS